MTEQEVNNYDASNPSKNDLVEYDKTWWRYVCGTGWVEQEYDQSTQRARDKGLPKGPNDDTIVKGFGETVGLKKVTFEVRDRHLGVLSRGNGYGPTDDQEGVYKIDWNCVVSYWYPRDKIWYNVKWNKTAQKFTKGDGVAPEGFPTKESHKVRKWNDSINVKDMKDGQEFYHDNKWWVKKGGQLIEQEWNERSNQFETKNTSLRGPSGKLAVGRFGKIIPKSSVSNYLYYDPTIDEPVYKSGEKSFMDAETGVVYYYAINAFSQMQWWYTIWDGGIGKFKASWYMSSGPTSDKVREWFPSTSGPFDLDEAENGQIVWYNKNFWKKTNGIWVLQAWDGSKCKFFIKKETTIPLRALIAPVGNDTLVRVFADNICSISLLRSSGSSGKGAYLMEDGDNYKLVYWWDGKTWSVPKWSSSELFESGTKREPNSLNMRRLNIEMKLSDVESNQYFWYMGTVWKKNKYELVVCGGINGMFDKKNQGKMVPIGKHVKESSDSVIKLKYNWS